MQLPKGPNGTRRDRAVAKADAPVTLEVCGDFQCPICARCERRAPPGLGGV